MDKSNEIKGIDDPSRGVSPEVATSFERFDRFMARLAVRRVIYIVIVATLLVIVRHREASRRAALYNAEHPGIGAHADIRRPVP